MFLRERLLRSNGMWTYSVRRMTEGRVYLGARRMQFGFVALLGARDAFQDQDDRPPHRADVDRLIGRVQDEYSAIHRDTS